MRQGTTFDIRKYIARKLQRILFIEADEDFYTTPPLTIISDNFSQQAITC
tara:strand:+ start:461 stop:610 length:150 start_codon:yes stop_codon:yes gene_type:complete